MYSKRRTNLGIRSKKSSNRTLNKTKKTITKNILRRSRQNILQNSQRGENFFSSYEMPDSFKYINEHNLLLKTLERHDVSKLFTILVSELIKKTNNNINEVDNIILKILTLLYNQTITDPPYYVSHALDHSIRVTVKMFELLTTIPELNILMTEKYNDSMNLLILFAGLLHDVGYSDLVYCLNGKMNAIHNNVNDNDCSNNKGIPANKKFLHSVSSKRITKQNFQSHKLFDANATQVLLDSIKEHNFDVNGCDNRHDMNKPESCSFKPTEREHSFYIASSGKADEIIYRDYIEADIQDKPLLFALRIADNLDFEYSRLTNVQQDENLMIVQRTIYMNTKINIDDDPKMEGVLKTEIESLRPSISLDTYEIYEREIMTVIINSLKKNEFLFNYSNWIVEKTELIKTTEGVEPNAFKMRVKFRAVKNTVLDARSNYTAAVYQINRCAESFSSLKFNSINLTDLIRVELIYADGKNESKSLKDFKR